MIIGRGPRSAILGAVFALAANLSGSLARADADRAGHYTTADGSIGFVLDLSGESPRQRFDSSPEILLLKPVAGPRGDTIYRRSDGRVVIRSTPYGALTLYSAESPDGVPVLRDGEAQALLPSNRTMNEVSALGPLFERHLASDDHLAIHVESPPPKLLTTQTALNTLGDALENAYIAIDHVASMMGNTDIGASVTTIRFVISDKRGVDMANKTLTIRFVPREQLAGRPTSYDIAAKVRAAILADKAAQTGISAESLNEQHSFDFRW